MTEDDVVEKLRLLRNDAGTSIFQRGLKKFNRQRLEVDVEKRQKRITFKWTLYKRKYERQAGICPLCKEPMRLIRGELAMDHISPNEENFNSEFNLQVTHPKCNSMKGGKSLAEQSKFYGKTTTELLESGL